MVRAFVGDSTMRRRFIGGGYTCLKPTPGRRRISRNESGYVPPGRSSLHRYCTFYWSNLRVFGMRAGLEAESVPAAYAHFDHIRISRLMSANPKYVYSFGNGSAEGSREMKSLLGGKGANLGRNECHRPARASRLHRYDGSMPFLWYPRPRVAGGAGAASQGRFASRGGGTGSQTGRRPQTAPGFRTQRCRAVHAGHDGHGAEPRPDRHGGRRAGAGDGQSPICVRRLPAIHRHVRRGGHGRAPRPFRGSPAPDERGKGGYRRPGAGCRRPEAPRQYVQVHIRYPYAVGISF